MGVWGSKRGAYPPDKPADQEFAEYDGGLIAALDEHMAADVSRIILEYTNARTNACDTFWRVVRSDNIGQQWMQDVCRTTRPSIVAYFLGITANQVTYLRNVQPSVVVPMPLVVAAVAVILWLAA